MIYRAFDFLAVFYFTIMVYGAITNLSWLVDPNTQYLSYEELPQDLKIIVDDYERKAKANGVDTRPIKKMIYILYTTKGSHGGFGFKTLPYFVGIRYTKNQSYYVSKKKVWHEFGHILLGYGHETETDHMMNYKTSCNHQNNQHLEKSYFKKKVNYWSFKGFIVTTYYQMKTILSF